MRKQSRMTIMLGFAVLVSLLISACSSGSSGSSTPGAGNTPTASCPAVSGLTGAGSTFDNPLFSKMFAPNNYPKTKCGVNVNYQSVGSGAGINQLLAHTVDFGATDTPLTDTQEASSTGGLIIHVPVTLGAVAMSYNLAGVSGHLNLTPTIIAGIYLGTTTFWDDAAIKTANPGVTLPHQSITPVHRSDGSGTTGIFTHYLSAVSPTWSSKVGAATTVNWPVGVGGKGNAGVAAAVKSTSGAIGYVELAYVISNNLSYAAVQNASGKLVLPSIDGAKADAAGVTNIPADLRFFIVNAPGDGAYPISGFSWVVVYKTQSNTAKGQALANMLWWMSHEGQQFATPLNYAPLPAAIVTAGEGQIKSMDCGGSPCYTGIVS
jgi:phosphate transport system substrate-binding protein